jgi:hypothetical protein
MNFVFLTPELLNYNDVTNNAQQEYSSNGAVELQQVQLWRLIFFEEFPLRM